MARYDLLLYYRHREILWLTPNRCRVSDQYSDSGILSDGCNYVTTDCGKQLLRLLAPFSAQVNIEKARPAPPLVESEMY